MLLGGEKTSDSRLPRMGWKNLLVPLVSLLPVFFVTNVSSDFSLSKDCPPGFLLDSGGKCRMKSLYHFYGSLQGKGLGGMKAGLPPHRDGFSPEQIDLGRLLFFDPVLSGDNNLSCANCHNPRLGFSDGMGRSVGSGGRINKRSAPTLSNTAFLDTFFWDSCSPSLEDQALDSLFAGDEMASTPNRMAEACRLLLANIKNRSGYVYHITNGFKSFVLAFG